MKLFGRELFTFKKKEDQYLYNFAQHGLVDQEYNIANFISTEELQKSGDKNKKKGRPRDVIRVTAKGIYHMGSLNDHDFIIKVDPGYIDEQVEYAQEKLKLYPVLKKIKFDKQGWGVESGSTKYGREEVVSIIERLNNRKNISKAKEVVAKYPHTTSALINQVLKENDNLRCNRADEFIPDFPRVAVKAMEEYNSMCLKVCDKKTYFYVIADKKDFEVKNKRRDPILLAQSPFGFFWQILGAWDEEMIYLGDL